MSYSEYTSRLTKIADIVYSMALLGWDQETYMPEKGAGFRAQQTATLSGIAHGMATNEQLGKILSELNKNGKNLSEKEKRNVSRSLKEYNKQKKYTTEFVELLSKTTSECFQAWQKAKKENNFSIYAPHLTKMVDLKRQEAELLGYEGHSYNAMLDQYEPEANVADLDVLFKDVREQMVDFVKEIAAAPQNDDAFMYKHYPKDKQWAFGIELLKQMNFDFEAGRQDISIHPFTTSFSSLDVRVTTKVIEDNLQSMIWSCIHEGGHGLYEQGLPSSEYGLPSGEAISLGIHESQSRLWENNVGRCLPYWKANYKKLQSYYPENLKNVTLEQFYKAMNRVEPSLIRIEADELTYHFHILIRYEIEKKLLGGEIKVSELPEFWNSCYKDYLGVNVTSDAEGVLQDIHWSHGSFGYFPTYSLGSFYAAQFFNQAKKEIKGLEKEIEGGNLLPLLQWLREKIHKHGKFYTAEELCTVVTGEKLNFKYFMDYAKHKYSSIYNLKQVAVN
ncbi:MAG TPA: carboxypeptidase M32 [Bacteroidia bacterium]|jgi:carboxypeptidase Taq|nr:carboxypeptidase M32 [Bacteroidia bacterium]